MCWPLTPDHAFLTPNLVPCDWLSTTVTRLLQTDLVTQPDASILATTTSTSDHHQQQPRRQGSDFLHPSGIQYPSWEYDLCEVRAQFLAYETYKLLLLLSCFGGSKSIRVYKKYLSLCSQKKWETTIITQAGFVILLAGEFAGSWEPGTPKHSAMFAPRGIVT